MAERIIFPIPTIFAGLDTKHSEEIKAAKSKFRLVQNMRFNGDEGNKRGGQSKYNTTRIAAYKIDSLYRLYPEDYTRVMIAVCNGSMYEGTDATGAWTSIKGSLTAGKKFSFAEMYDTTDKLNLYMFNGVDAPQYWDGDAAATSSITGTPPTDKYVVFHRDRLFSAGNTTTPQFISWCANSNPNNWTAADDAGTMDVGFKITGLVKMSDYIVIFGERKIKLLIGYSYDTFRLTEPFADIGTKFPYSIKNCGGIIYFLTEVREDTYQVARFDGALARLVNDDVELTLAYPARAEQVDSNYDNDRYELAYPSGDGANDKVLVFNTKYGVFESIDDRAINCFCKWDGTLDSGEVYAGDPSDGFVRKQNTGLLDDTTAIDAYCETAYYPLGGDEYEKQFTDVYVKCELSTTQTLTVTAKSDEGTSSDAQTLTGAGASVAVEHRKTSFSLTGRTIAVRLANSTASKDMGIKLASFAFELLKLR